MNKWSLPTKYNGTQMRSKLETRIAYLLDQLDIKWEYEPKTFHFEELTYIPDFYLPDHDQWIEAKGIMTTKDIIKVELLTKQNNEVLFIEPDNITFYELLKTQRIHKNRTTNLLNCSNCKQYSFVSPYMSWHCRVCGLHNGDRDIQIYNLNLTENKPNTLTIDKKEHISDWVRRELQ